MRITAITLRKTLGAGVSCLALTIAVPAMAQNAEGDEQVLSSDGGSPLTVQEEGNVTIVVSGSRVPRSTFDTPLPVTILDAEDLQKSSPSTLAAALNNQPALVAGGGPNATSGQRTAGRNTLDLRGIGTGRTLTLVNGRRFPGSQPGGAVDTNLIPQGLVSRVEVVTGGASAAYGSDAVAGVVNFILDTRYEGLKVNAGYGISERGDGAEYRAGATFGSELGNSGLYFVVSGEYYKNKGIAGDARDWRRQGANLIPNPNGDGTAANPDLIIADQARLGDATFGGFIASLGRNSPSAARVLLGQQFLSGGILAPFETGVNNSGGLQDGGDGINTAVLQPITRPLERATIYSGLDFQATDNLSLYVNGSYGYSRSSNTAAPFHAGRFGATITSSNAYLDPAIASLLGSRGTFRLNRYDSEYDMTVDVKNQNKRIEAGFELGLGGFTLDVSGQLGSNRERALNSNNFIVDRYAQGIDTILVGGVAVCRDQSDGCVPINPFGVGSYSQEAIEWFTGTSLLETRVKAQIAQATLTGNLFDGIGAGPWGVAVGAEYRHDEVEVIVDDISENLGYFTNNFRGYAADRSVKEAFGEINMPLLKGVSGAELLEVGGAVRRTDYENSGAVTTWKLKGQYSPLVGLRFRGSYSRDIRAPNQAEMFTRGRQRTLTVNDLDPNTPNATPTVLISVQGNPLLVPERAKTLVLGVVAQPDFIPGLSLSVDRFDIDMNDAISTLSDNQVIRQCYLEDNAQACAQIIRDDTGVITQINNSNFNLDKLRVTGWDFEGRYQFSVANGRMSMRAQVSMLDRFDEQGFDTDGNVQVVSRVGETTTPKWRGLASVNYENGPFNLFLQGRYIGENVVDINYLEGDSEYINVPSAFYLDGQIGVKVKNIQFSLNIQNILDKDPVFSPIQDQYYSPTNQNVYDQVGRAYRFNIRAEF